MKKILAIVLAAMMLLSMAACSPTANKQDDGKYTIGICQLVQHPALDAATQGFKDAVIAGLGEENVTFLDKNASGDASTCTTIVGDFVNQKVDLIMANATPAVAAAYAKTEFAPIPVLGTSVTDYGVALGIDNFSGTVGGNVSGTSDLAPLDQQAQMILDWVPNAKKVAMLYCKAEANSQCQIDEVVAYLQSKGIECKSFAFSDASDMQANATSAAQWGDAIYIPTDNTAATYATAIGEISLAEKTPVIAGESGICASCGIATLTIDYYDLGVKTGEMAVEILKNGKDISTMAIEKVPADKLQKLYNKEICEKLGITPLDGYEPLS